MEDKVDGACMVFNKKPVADILAFSIYGKWPLIFYIILVLRLFS